MSCFDIKKQVYGYLGYKNYSVSQQTDALIDECIAELDRDGGFRAVHKIYADFPEFLKAEPYRSFLDGCEAAVLSVTTLGHETDRRIRELSLTDMAKSVVYDCCASAYLEYRADRYESGIAKVRTYRFCPGYGGSSITDLVPLFECVKPFKIGVTLSESCFMLPSKSMAGVIGIGKTAEKSCGDCIKRGSCEFLKEGVKCYSRVKP